uniref:DUF1758 domain-containing protein n=1 Tax=Caenorhabditis japonica TaxID=281687 RepID=A0A8R1I6H5_CAEJA
MLKSGLSWSTRTKNALLRECDEAEKLITEIAFFTPEQILENDDSLFTKINEMTSSIKATESALEKLAMTAEGLDPDNDIEQSKFEEQADKVNDVILRGVTEDNYALAINLLKERYDDSEATIAELNDRFKFVKATNTSISEQRKSWDKIHILLQQLDTLGENIDHYMVKDAIVEKFSYDIRKEIYERKYKLSDVNDWTIEQLIYDIEETIKHQEKLRKKLKLKDEENPKDLQRNKPKKYEEKYKDSKSNFQTKCLFCQGEHFSDRCLKVTSPKDRMDVVRKRGACKICFKLNHKSDDCPRQEYSCKKCNSKDKHNASICTSWGESPIKQTENSKQGSKKPNKQTNAATILKDERDMSDEEIEERNDEVKVTTTIAKNTAYLPTLKTEVFNNNSKKWEPMSIMIDTGSDTTYVTKELLEKMLLPKLNTTLLKVRTFDDEAPKPKEYVETELRIKNGTEELTIGAYATKDLAGKIEKAVLTSEDLQFMLKQQLQINSDVFEKRSDPQMILGCDYFCQIWQGALIPLPSGICLVKTTMGYTTIGTSQNKKKFEEVKKRETINFTAVTVENETDESTNERKEEDNQKKDMAMKSSEFDKKKKKKKIDRRTMEFFKKTIEKREDGYYVRLPFKQINSNIPTNWSIAMKRLLSVVKYQSIEVLGMIDTIFKDQLELQVIEKVDMSEEVGGLVHYNPHQPVLIPHKTTTKCRVVIDGSSHFKNEPSLNDMIHQGPVILPDLTQLLIRFRTGKIAILSDVEKAFLQVRLHEIDRDATRILWLKDYRRPATPDNIEVYRYTRILFGFNASPFLLAATILHHLESHPNKQLAVEMAKNLYVDNLILTTDKEPEEAIQLYYDSKETFSSMKMNLREFLSNSKIFNEMIENKDRAQDTDMKVLGILWSSITDEITIGVLNELPTNISRRTISSFLSGNYDPLGLLVPILLPIKLFQRKLWDDTLDWDTPLNDELSTEWKETIT